VRVCECVYVCVFVSLCICEYVCVFVCACVLHFKFLTAQSSILFTTLGTEVAILKVISLQCFLICYNHSNNTADAAFGRQ